MVIAANSTPADPTDIMDGTPQHPLSVITLADHDDLAIIVPSNIDTNLTWIASTFGIRASCSGLTPKCTDFTVPDENVDDATISFNCSDAGFPYIPFDVQTWASQHPHAPLLNATGRIGAMLDNNKTLVMGSLYDYYLAGGPPPENPQHVQVQLTWPLTIEASIEDSSYVAFDPYVAAWAFADCEMSFFNVTVQYDEGKFDLVVDQSATLAIGGSSGTQLSSREFTAVMWAPLINQFINLQLHANLQAIGLSDQNDDPFIGALNQEIARLSLAAFAGSTMATSPHMLSISTSSLVGPYPTAPVIAYTSLLFLYSAIVLGIFG
ncbi:hypothetical protein BDN72DRAFT_961746, partial [Pluteus cervinus]